jgi:putative ABC transport system permease protein
MLSLVFDALQQSLIFLPITVGIYLTYRIVRITDLTVGGSFSLGAAIFSRLITSGFSELFSIFFALLGGLGAGFGVFLLQRFAKINALIASILAVFMLFSVNFGIMGQPNISLLNTSTLLGTLQSEGTLVFNQALVLFNGLLMAGLFFLLKSRFGLRLRAYGSNPGLLARLGHRAPLYLAFGLMLSNLLAALCGVMTAEINGYADIHMDDGVALTAIGAVVIGIHLVRSLCPRSFLGLGLELLGCFLGVFVYFFVLHLFLAMNLNPIYLKLCLGVLLAVCLSTAHYSSGKKGGEADVLAS